MFVGFKLVLLISGLLVLPIFRVDPIFLCPPIFPSSCPEKRYKQVGKSARALSHLLSNCFRELLVFKFEIRNCRGDINNGCKWTLFEIDPHHSPKYPPSNPPA